ncbi:MAG: autotransporter-associated beta strand repeat-containing protein [Phycisphaerae bacterium]|jgi:autotransporter-associated beta strand protein
MKTAQTKALLAKFTVIAAMALVFMPLVAHAANQSWTGGSVTDGNWSTIGNWSGGAAPGSTAVTNSTDVATFNAAIANTWGNAAGNPVVIDSVSQNIGGISFDTAAGNYFIGSTGGTPLLLTSNGTIQILNTLTVTNAVETINAPLVIEGAGGIYTLQNNSANGTGPGAGTLNIGGVVSGGGIGAAVLNLAGTNANANTISGNITNGTATTLSVTKSGAGTWILSGSNTYTGNTTVSSGTLQAGIASVAGVGAFGNNSTVKMSTAAGAVLNLNGFNTQIGSLQGGGTTGGNVTLGVATLTVGGDNTTTTYSGSISGSGGITKIGTGYLKLYGSNSYTGDTTINGSNVQIGDGATSGSISSLSLVTGASGNLMLNRSDSFTFGNKITGSIGLLKYGTNTLTLTGNNTYTIRTSIYSGALSVSSLNSVGTGHVTGSNLGAPITVADGTIVLGATTTSGQLTYTGSGETTDRVINLNGTTGGGTIDQSGTTGLLKFTSNNTATGGGSKTLTLQGSTSGTGEIRGAIVDNSVTNTTSVTKGGTGTWTLSGTNTYTGTTTVNAGTLLINGSTSASSVLTVNSGGTLGGGGTIGGATTVASGAILSPGNSPGNLTFSNGLTLAGGYKWELAALSTSNPGTDFDIITVTVGNVDITGASMNLTLGGFSPTNVAFWQATQTWTGILNNTGAGSLTGSFAAIDNSSWASLGAFTTNYVGNDVNLVWTAVPEPATWALLAFSLTTIMVFRRRPTSYNSHIKEIGN